MIFAVDLISPQIPALSPEEKVSDSLSLLQKLKLKSLPLVDKDLYIGLLEEQQLGAEESADAFLSSLNIPELKPAVGNASSLFDALKIMGEFRLDILPVVDSANRYNGVITSESLLTALSRFNSAHQIGSLVVLEVDIAGFMFSEIVKIAEGEEVTILGMHSITDVNIGKLTIVLKTNRENLNSFIASLQQADYKIVYRFDHPEDESSLKQNYDHLMNYINM